MSEPMAELQFTEEEIDHGVKALLMWRAATRTDPFGVGGKPVSDLVRAVLRAVRAVPARCLNGGLAGHPAAPGAKVQGTGLGGVLVRGTVVYSYPVTTAVRTPGNGVEFIWTNTIRSWDPSTEPLRERVEQHFGLPTMITEDVPDGAAWVVGPPSTGRVPTPASLRGSALGLTSGKVWLSGDTDEMLRADDDGMKVEDGR